MAQWALGEKCESGEAYAEFLAETDELWEELQNHSPIRYIDLAKVF